jgi:CRISPR-associated protein Csm1
MWYYTFKDEELSDEVRKEKKKYVPLLKYKLARTVKDDTIRADLNKKLVVNPGYMPWIKIPVSWVSMRTR